MTRTGTHHITKAQAEQLIDTVVQRTLAIDRAYCYAESAEAQVQREEAITRAVEADIARRFAIKAR